MSNVDFRPPTPSGSLRDVVLLSRSLGDVSFILDMKDGQVTRTTGEILNKNKRREVETIPVFVWRRKTLTKEVKIMGVPRKHRYILVSLWNKNPKTAKPENGLECFMQLGVKAKLLNKRAW